MRPSRSSPNPDPDPDSKPTNSFASILTGRVCIVGIGNRGRGDDGAGPREIDQRPTDAKGAWIDAGDTPENFLEPIARTEPETVLLIDAVDFGAEAGQWRLMEVGETESYAVSTHAGSLGVLAEYLSVRTGARVRVLGIQPEQVGLGKELSDPVARSVARLAAMLSNGMSPATRGLQT